MLLTMRNYAFERAEERLLAFSLRSLSLFLPHSHSRSHLLTLLLIPHPLLTLLITHSCSRSSPALTLVSPFLMFFYPLSRSCSLWLSLILSGGFRFISLYWVLDCVF